ncbi:hypothetical protein BV20DRAFT_964078 [Pilatotrama ljubarskyi]|nr:hypothetical protein BV20DRAFT_964078 [Pilatotrama ljubarskyi]
MSSSPSASDPSAAAAAAAALQQLLELHQDAQVVAFCAVAGYTWFLFDFLMLLPTEIQFVWTTKWNLSKLLFLWVRFFGIVLLTVNIAVTLTGAHSVKFCEFYFYWEGTAGSLMLYSVEIILQLRIYAMYHKNKWLAIFNAAFFFSEITVMLIVYNYGISVGTTLATPPGLTGCYGITTSYLFSIWIPGLIFEMWLVVLAIWKAIERAREGVMVNGQRLDLLALLIRDNVIYFVVIALGLLTNTVMWFAAPDGLAPAAVSLSHASMIVSGTRLLLNLFEAFHRRVNRARTTTGLVTEDASTLPTFRAAKRSGLPSEASRGRSAGWSDTTVLTNTEFGGGAYSETDASEIGDAELEAAVLARGGIYRLENLYGPDDGETTFFSERSGRSTLGEAF